MEFLVYGLLIFALLICLLSAAAPTQIAYSETITVQAPRNQVYDDIRLQDRLMRWSAWPAETNSTCAVDGEDGASGAQTVFYTKGKRTGHQEIISLKENESVAMTLVGPGPPHKPRIEFNLQDAGANETQVTLHFENTFPRPFNAIWKYAGLSKWTRTMHRKDLLGLKAFSEPPHLDAAGQAVGHPPAAEPPFQHRQNGS